MKFTVVKPAPVIPPSVIKVELSIREAEILLQILNSSESAVFATISSYPLMDSLALGLTEFKEFSSMDNFNCLSAKIDEAKQASK